MKSPFSFLIPFIACTVFAQKEAVDNVTFSPPTGWTREKSESGVIYAQSDAKSGSFCKLVIIKAIIGSGKVKNDFDAAWNSLVKDSLKIQDTPQMQPKETKNGWDILTGGGTFDVEKEKVAVILLSATNASTTQSVLVLTNSAQYQADIQAFLTSLDVKKTSTDTKPAVTETAKVPQLWIKSAFVKIYTNEQGYHLTYSHKFLAFYSNGDFYAYFPEEGFLGFDHDPADTYWGKGTLEGKRITLETKALGKINLEKVSDTQWNEEGKSDQKYMLCKSVDGLKLEGSYCPDGPDWPKIDKKTTIPPGGPTYITFKKDGTFIDHGRFNNTTLAKPASGTYRIKDFTLVLTYEDGIVKKRAFCSIGGADPFKDDKTYFIGQYPWFKGKP